MFKRKLLCCSFCGKDETMISKLVAGPKVHICDECVAIASEIMQSDGSPPVKSPPPVDTVWTRVRKFFADHINGERFAAGNAPNAHAR